MKPSSPQTSLSSKRTFKREIALLNLALWWVLVLITGWGALSLEGDMASLLIDVLKITTIPVWAFAAAAYGMDWHAKQSRWSNSQYQSADYYENNYQQDGYN